MQSGRRGRVATVCGLLLAALVAWVVLSGPMLINLQHGPLQGLRVWNPTRDRSPERAATEYLQRIQSTDCQQQIAGVQTVYPDKATACAKQARLPITDSCRLVERSDEKSGVWLLFYCPYQDSSPEWAEVDLFLKHDGSSWVLTSYERIY